MSPTQRTLAALRKDGYLAAIVEKWNPHARRRVDLFGFVDVLAVHDGVDRREGEKAVVQPGYTLAIQCTTGSHVANRVAKIRESPHLPMLVAAGWRVEAWGWRKLKGRWALRRERVT